MKKFPFYRQLDQSDCGPTCLRMIAKYYGRVYSRELLRERCHITKQGVSALGITEAADSIGLRSLFVTVDYDSLRDEVPFPAIAHWRERHFIVITDVTKKHVKVADPAFGHIQYEKKDFLAGWLPGKSKLGEDKGGVILMEPAPDFYERPIEDVHKKQSWIKFLISYLRPFRNYINQLMIGLLVVSIIQLIFPFLTQSLVDYGIRNQNINFIYLILIAQVTLFLSQSSAEIIRGWLLLHLGTRVNISILSDFLNRLLKLPIPFFDGKSSGDILQRLQDSERLEQFLSSTTLNVLFSIVNLVLFGAILLYYNLSIFLIFAVGSILYVAWVLLFLKRRAVLDFMRFDQSAETSSNVLTMINGVEEIKLNNSNRRRRWEWEASQIKLFKISIKSLALSQYQNRGGAIINELKNILITAIAAKSVVDGYITLGVMLAVQYIIGQLNGPINNLVTFITSAQDSKISLERLNEVHEIQEENPADADRVKDLDGLQDLRVDKVSFRYGGPSFPYVLQGMSFSIPKNKVTAVVGASGSGKTTLLKLLLKFYEPQSGKVYVGGHDLSKVDTIAWRRKCGVVMQNGYIFGDTIVRNITESDSQSYVDKEKLLRAVRIANIEELIESFPAGYNSRIGASGIQLSGGQKQRILIARAVYKDPDYLFFDEATSALDANNEEEIINNLNAFYQNRTVLVIAHRLSTVRDADQIIVMEKGQIIEVGDHDELTQKKGAYYTLVKNQLELGN